MSEAISNQLRVDVQNAGELARWSKRLGITPEQLKRAVKQVGPQMESLKQYLGQGPARDKGSN